MIVNSADDAIQASHIIEQSQFGGVKEKLRTHIVKLPGEQWNNTPYIHIIYPHNIILHAIFTNKVHTVQHIFLLSVSFSFHK